MTSITVRDVPDAVRDELAARAGRAGRSLQEHLRLELIDLASRPAPADLMIELRRRKAATGIELAPDEIVGLRDADRR